MSACTTYNVIYFNKGEINHYTFNISFFDLHTSQLNSLVFYVMRSSVTLACGHSFHIISIALNGLLCASASLINHQLIGP